jgi:hypothetical protein
LAPGGREFCGTPDGAPPPGGFGGLLVGLLLIGGRVVVTVDGGLLGGVLSVGVGVMSGVQVTGNGKGSVQVGVGDPIVQLGHGMSRVGGTAVLVTGI